MALCVLIVRPMPLVVPDRTEERVCVEIAGRSRAVEEALQFSLESGLSVGQAPELQRRKACGQRGGAPGGTTMRTRAFLAALLGALVAALVGWHLRAILGR